MTILIVEDDESISGVMALILGSEGYDVVSASNGEQALARLRAQKDIDLVLTDLMMPVEDGWRLVEQIRADETLASTPIVIVTGVIDPDRLPADVPVLSKPFKMSVLLETVRARSRRAATMSARGSSRPSEMPPPA